MKVHDAGDDGEEGIMGWEIQSLIMLREHSRRASSTDSVAKEINGMPLLLIYSQMVNGFC